MNRSVLLCLFVFLGWLAAPQGCVIGEQKPCQTTADCRAAGTLCLGGFCAKASVKKEPGPADSSSPGDRRLSPELRPNPDLHSTPELRRPPEEPVSREDPSGEAVRPDERPAEPPPTGCVEGQQRSCYDGPQESWQKGLCQRGSQRCAGGTWGPCTGQVLPAKEACDGKDNDCDGTIDEGCQCVVGESRQCYPSKDGGCTQARPGVWLCKGPCKAGTQRCVGGKWGSCTGAAFTSPEICDGKDNDCDGKVDQDIPLAGTPCALGKGFCRKAGVYVCDGPFFQLRCDAIPGTKANEKCDGIDNDCDGKTDEGCNCKNGTIRSCGDPLGECRKGTQKCGLVAVGTYRWGNCKLSVESSPELCDGKDNDCDGSVDEGCCAPTKVGTGWQAHSGVLTLGITGLRYDAHRRYWVTTADDQKLLLWDTRKTPIAIRRTMLHSSPVVALAISVRGNYYISATANREIVSWDSGGKVRHTFKGSTAAINVLAFNSEDPDDDDEGVVASGSADGTLRLWNLEKEVLLKTLSGHTASVDALAFSPDTLVLASGSADKSIRIWNKSGTFLRSLQGHTGGVVGLAFHPNSKILYSIGLDSTLRRWDVASSKLLHTAPNETPLQIAVSPNASWIAVLYKSKKIRLFDMLQHKLRLTLSFSFTPTATLTWGPNQSLLVGDAKGYVHQWTCP